MILRLFHNSKLAPFSRHRKSWVHGWDLVWRAAVVLLCNFNWSSVMVDLSVIVVPDYYIILSLFRRKLSINIKPSPPPPCGQPTSVNPYKCGQELQWTGEGGWRSAKCRPSSHTTSSAGCSQRRWTSLWARALLRKRNWGRSKLYLCALLRK